MKTVTFEEYQKAKNEIIGGVAYSEHTHLEEDGRISKQYATEKMGLFCEVTKNGITEFWSDKYPESRYYDDRSQKEIAEYYESIIAKYRKENAELSVLKNEYQKAMNDNHEIITTLLKTVDELKTKLVAIQTLTQEVAA